MTGNWDWKLSKPQETVVAAILWVGFWLAIGAFYINVVRRLNELQDPYLIFNAIIIGVTILFGGNWAWSLMMRVYRSIIQSHVRRQECANAGR